MPMPSINCVSNWPARPTNGPPFRPSCSPGPSPTNINSASARPTPNTTCVRPAASLHCEQSCAAAATSSSVANMDTSDPNPGSVADGLPDRVGNHLDRDGAEAIEVHLDDPGRERDREVAVEARV